jgi:hypothetical protein
MNNGILVQGNISPLMPIRLQSNINMLSLPDEKNMDH